MMLVNVPSQSWKTPVPNKVYITITSTQVYICCYSAVWTLNQWYLNLFVFWLLYSVSSSLQTPNMSYRFNSLSQHNIFKYEQINANQ